MKFNLTRFIEIVDRLAPAVLAVTPGGDKIAPLVPKIVKGIKEAQAIKGASGAEKKQHVLNTIAAGADVARGAGVKISSEEITAIASRGIDTVIEAVHVVEGAKATRPGEVSSAAAGLVAGAPGSLPGVDTATRQSDLPGGRATHGHGSGDDVPPAPPSPANDANPDPGGRSIADNPAAPPSRAFEGGAGDRPPSDSTNG
jgi:hypothetical protein